MRLVGLLAVPGMYVDVLHVLQAFRHLYVLATEPRYVEAIDVDSRASVCVPLSVTMQQHTQVICVFPLYVPGVKGRYLLHSERESVQCKQQCCCWSERMVITPSTI